LLELPLKKTIENFFAATTPGLEEVCAAEMKAIGLKNVHIVPGGVDFSGDLRDLYLANLWLRTAGRIVVRIGEFGCRDFPEFYRRALRLPWGRFVRPGTPLRVRAVSHRSRLMHTGRLEETALEAAARALGGGPRQEREHLGEQLVLVRVQDDRCVVSVDSSGELLHRRGYRLHSGAAPLRETLAAGLLGLLGWDGEVPLLDPLCGSGTIAIEGAMLARRMAPGRDRSFAFMDWPGWRPGLWEALRHEARGNETDVHPLVVASDRDSSVLAVARQNAQRAGVSDGIDFRCETLARIRPEGPPGILLCNPPYGGRLEAGEDLRPLFQTIGEVGQRFGGWRIAFLCPDERLARATGLPVVSLARLDNGGISVHLFTLRLD
jgi:putative N6-adenine-specific DNA methylase